MVGAAPEMEPLFVGRDSELGVLAAGLRDARGGRTRFIVVTGDAGIGKTRTVEEFVRQAALPAGRVLWGRAPEQAGAPSYWPWIRAFEQYVAAADALALREQVGADGPLLAHLAPALRTRCPDIEPTPPEGGDAEARFRLLDALTSVLRRIAATDELLLVLEDLHWADEASLALLAFVAAELRAARLLLVATYREHEPHRRPRGLDRRRPARAARAAARSRPDRRGRARRPRHRRARRRLRSSSACTRSPRATRSTSTRCSASCATAAGSTIRPADGAPVPLPESVRDTLRRRLDPLQPEDRELLSLASVVGREFDVVLLHRALDATPETVLARLTAATAIGLVEETPTVGRFRFAHALVHETIYGDLLPAARARLHQRVAEALEALHADRADPPLAELAAHYARAAPLGTAAKAVECSIRAAQQAAAILAYADAMAHYERALAALALLAPDERKRLEICSPWVAPPCGRPAIPRHGRRSIRPPVAPGRSRTSTRSCWQR